MHAPEASHVSRAVELWRNKVKWRIMLEGSEPTLVQTSEVETMFNIAELKSKFRTPVCEHETPVDSLVQKLHDDILACVVEKQIHVRKEISAACT